MTAVNLGRLPSLSHWSNVIDSMLSEYVHDSAKHRHQRFERVSTNARRDALPLGVMDIIKSLTFAAGASPRSEVDEYTSCGILDAH